MPFADASQGGAAGNRKKVMKPEKHKTHRHEMKHKKARSFFRQVQ
jgi:hypothetical protein